MIKKLTKQRMQETVEFCVKNSFNELDSLGLDKKKLYEAMIHDCLSKGKDACLSIAKNKITGFILFEKLDFDTTFFKKTTYRITDLILESSLEPTEAQSSAAALIKYSLQVMKKKGTGFIQCKLDSRNTYAAKAIQEQEFFIASEDVTLHKKLENINKMKIASDIGASDGMSGGMSDYRVSYCKEEDINPLYDLSKKAYKTTRFHQDKNISQEDADEMQGVWIKNCYYKKLADEIILIKEKKIKQGKDLCGYVACGIVKEYFINKLKIGRIILIAADETCRGKGVGSMLVRESDAWFKKQGCSGVVVGTQKINEGAVRFYQKNGFSVFSSTLCFHKWL